MYKMDLLKINKVLVLAPHPDDVELGCGAFVNRLIEDGAEVFYAVFSPCTISVPEGFEKDILYQELDNSCKVLGVKNSNIIKFNFPVREFPKHRQEILEELINLKKKIKPELILLPSSNDLHQDHSVINAEGVRAFKTNTVLGYELPWNNRVSINNFFVNVSEKNINCKIDALKSYKSQGFRIYFNDDFIMNLAKMRGALIGNKYAESFEFITASI